MGLPSGGAQAVIARLSLLTCGDPEASARELMRVLTPGGPFSLAVWHDQRLNTLVWAAYTVLRRHLSADQLPPGNRPDPLAAAGRREAILTRAGLASVRGTDLGWTYDFPDADALWFGA